MNNVLSSHHKIKHRKVTHDSISKSCLSFCSLRPKFKGNVSLTLPTIICHKVRHTINGNLIEIKVGIIIN